MAAARAGAAFAGEAWRDAWAPLTLVAAGQAGAFACARLDIPNALASRLEACGWIVSAIALLPALGALYRSAVGGPALKRIGWGGLQFEDIEHRMLGAGLLLAAAGACAISVLLLAGAAAWYPLRNLGVLRLPLIGPFGLWFLAAAPILLVVGWGLLIGLSRLALVLPAVAAERRVQLGRTLRGSRRWSGSLAAATLVLDIAPLLVLLTIVQVLNGLERGQAVGLAGSVWPTPDAVAAGVVLSLLWAFVLLPVGVGGRTYFYGRVLAEARASDRRRLLSEEAPAANLKLVAAEEPLETVTPAAAEGPSDAAAASLAPTPDEGAGPAEPAHAAPAAADVEGDAVEHRQVSAQPVAATAGGRWIPPVAPMRGAGLAQAVTTPILLAHANDRDLPPPWWIPPEHPEEPPVA